jgi:hypothetical protein
VQARSVVRPAASGPYRLTRAAFWQLGFRRTEAGEGGGDFLGCQRVACQPGGEFTGSFAAGQAQRGHTFTADCERVAGQAARVEFGHGFR